MEKDRGSSIIFKAAREGNIEYLIQSLGTHPTDYFLNRSKAKGAGGVEHEFNIIHVAIQAGQAEFLKQLLHRLPIQHVLLLLSQELVTSRSYNAFHLAVVRRNLTLLKVLVEFVKSSFSSTTTTTATLLSSEKPWLAMDEYGKTPFFMAMDQNMEDFALELMSLDLDLLCNMVDADGVSSLVRAVSGGFSEVALRILTSGYPYVIAGYSDLSSILNYAPYCSEEVCKLLLDKHARKILKEQDEITLLYEWVLIGKVWPFKLLLNWSSKYGYRNQMIEHLNIKERDTGNTVFHFAACHCSEETVQITQLLIEAYKEEKKEDLSVARTPWKQVNNNTDTPLLTALNHKHEKLALYYISLDVEGLVINSPKSVLYAAVWNGCDDVVQNMLVSSNAFSGLFTHISLHSNKEQNVLHAASNCTERTASLLFEKLPWLIDEPDVEGLTPLDLASQLGAAWLVKYLLTTKPSLLKKSAWIEACEGGHTDAIKAFIEYAPDFKRHCIEAQDSPLHHIKLGNYNQYQEFLAIPFIQEMKNMKDFNNSTPLHLALQRNDILLAELLLNDNSISLDDPDNSGYTAKDWLTERCMQDNRWVEMCTRLKIRTNFYEGEPTITFGIKAEEYRSILSVVASLLATLTFAAGFTLPGGLNQENGEALLAKEASFLVFIVADAYAMCCSMLVLFLLMWSMIVGNRSKALIMLDRSVLILKQSLYGTLLAFMTGIFTVTSQKSMWASIVIGVMCSVVALAAVFANSSFLFTILNKFPVYSCNY